MYKLTDDLPLRVMFMMPSCVPATPFEHSGAELVAEDMEQFITRAGSWAWGRSWTMCPP